MRIAYATDAHRPPTADRWPVVVGSSGSQIPKRVLETRFNPTMTRRTGFDVPPERVTLIGFDEEVIR